MLGEIWHLVLGWLGHIHAEKFIREPLETTQLSRWRFHSDCQGSFIRSSTLSTNWSYFLPDDCRQDSSFTLLLLLGSSLDNGALLAYDRSYCKDQVQLPCWWWSRAFLLMEMVHYYLLVESVRCIDRLYDMVVKIEPGCSACKSVSDSLHIGDVHEQHSLHSDFHWLFTQ